MEFVGQSVVFIRPINADYGGIRRPWVQMAPGANEGAHTEGEPSAVSR
ncbi:hypothetical protein ABIC49_006436 [Burkholderia ambifaria]